MIDVNSSTRTAAVVVAVVVNTGGAVQARLNGELGARLHDGIAAPLVTTGIGLVLLAAVIPALPAGRRALGALRAAFRTGRLRWWHGLGGMCGALFVASQGLSVSSLGVAVFTVAVVAGNTTGSLLIDRWGLGPSGRHPVTRARIGAAAVCVAAVAIAGSGKLDAQGLFLILLPLVAGAALAWQTAVNGRVGAAAGSVMAATLLNFVVAVLTLAVVFLVEVAARGLPAGTFPHEPWLYSAGLIGISLIVVAAAVVSHTGVLLFGLASVSGQLLGAAGVDLAVGFRTAVATWIALGLTFVAVVIAARARSGSA
ncbi:DMT family transporter [Lentzea sp. NPDC058436]|uniref:DMT family transporter n=1 Tax=Lentzea sp. NPDC058436 TaxID=3346499 RepID=UPI00365BA93A